MRNFKLSKHYLKIFFEIKPSTAQRQNANSFIIQINVQKLTSREQPKSAPCLRLKKTRERKPLFLQLETTKALKKLKIEKKIFFSEFFFQNFFEVSGKSHSAEKYKRGDALGFFEHPFCCKISKIDGRNKKNFGKNQSHSVEKNGPFCFGMTFYLMLEALEALKTKY